MQETEIQYRLSQMIMDQLLEEAGQEIIPLGL